MSSTKTPSNESPDLATPLVHLSEVARLLAEKYNVPDGDYEIVMEFKIGNIALADDDLKYPGLGMAVAGIGLRPTVNPNAQTVSIRRAGAVEKPEARSAIKPVAKRPVRKDPPRGS